jgi:hypothetical protein
LKPAKKSKGLFLISMASGKRGAIPMPPPTRATAPFGICSKGQQLPSGPDSSAFSPALTSESSLLPVPRLATKKLKIPPVLIRLSELERRFSPPLFVPAFLRLSMFLRLSSLPFKTVFFRGTQPATLKGRAKKTLERLSLIKKNCPANGAGPGQLNSRLTVSTVTAAKPIHSQVKVLLGPWLFMLNLNTKIIKNVQAGMRCLALIQAYDLV